MREPGDVPMYRWPDAARFGRVIPKTKFYEHSNVTNAVRELFVAEVQRITWAFKLAENTIHLTGTKSVPEIQVFQVDAKNDDVSEVVLDAIDRAVTSPIIFEVRRGEARAGQSRLVAAHKQVGAGTPKVGTYFTTVWRPADAERAPLPAAIDLPSLYAALLAPLLPIESQPGEDAATLAARVEAAQKLEREIATLQRKLSNEPQLNRKVEMRRTLKTKQTILAGLASPTP